MSGAPSSVPTNGDVPPDRADVAVIGAGAAGLMAAISAGRAQPGRSARVVALDGAKTLGAKILVAGGGRCNVTHHAVDERDYAGSTAPAIRKVLAAFPVARTVEFFAEFGVELKREETGKLFPTTDSARTVLDALLRAAREAGVSLRHPWRVASVAREGDAFRVVSAEGETILARRVILATGGKSLPKSGSDGAGYGFATAFGHTLTSRVIPALVPLLLPDGHPLRELSGIAVDAEVRLVSSTGKVLTKTTNAVLCTHFGLSGPAILDISRHWSLARFDDPGAKLELSFLPPTTPDALDAQMMATSVAAPRETLASFTRTRLPERLMRTLAALANVDPATTFRQLSRDARKRLVRTLGAYVVEPTGDRGFPHAEVTAGGVPLAEVRLESMESRRMPGLFLCGEILDVDGRIGGFNFQWAWASGWVAGRSAGA